ncbi:TPA: hypothetical protein ACV8DA_001462 [Escherichia coli]
MSTNTPTEINKLFTDPAHIELTQKTLTEITNVLDERISEIDKDKHFATYMALQMQSMAMVIANQTISELYMENLCLERELAELRAQMKTDESPHRRNKRQTGTYERAYHHDHKKSRAFSYLRITARAD